MSELHGFPYREVQFTKKGRSFDEEELTAVETMLGDEGITDLLVISHGWKNNIAEARELYDKLAESLRHELENPPREGLQNAKLGIIGVFWPAKKFTDPDLIAGGGAGVGNEVAELKLELEDLEGFFDSDEAAGILSRARELADQLQEDEDAAAEFVELIRSLVVDGPEQPEEESDEDYLRLSGGDLVLALSGLETTPDDDDVAGGAAGGIDDAFGALFGSARSGALKALNMATYYQMKKRAGRVGEGGLHTLIQRLREKDVDLRLHLVGHSFGGKVATAAANGPAGETELVVNSLVLLQAAFSHHGFAKDFRGDEDGYYRPVVERNRVQGPIVVTHTKNDNAVKLPYALASRLARQDAAGVGGADDRFGAIGSNGAQDTPEVDNVENELKNPGSTYEFSLSKVYNLLSDSHIADHSDVKNRAVANAILEAVRPR